MAPLPPPPPPPRRNENSNGNEPGAGISGPRGSNGPLPPTPAASPALKPNPPAPPRPIDRPGNAEPKLPRPPATQSKGSTDPIRIVAYSLLGVAFLLAILFTAIKLLGSGIDKKAILEALTRDVATGNLSFVKLEKGENKEIGDSIEFAFEAEGLSKSPLFQPVDQDEYLRSNLGLEPDVLGQIKSIINSRDAAKIEELAGISKADAEKGLTIIRETTPASKSYKYIGSFKAKKTKDGWNLILEEGHFVNDSPVGIARGQFPGDTFIAGNPEDDASLKSVYGEKTQLLSRLKEAKSRFDAEQRRILEEKIARIRTYLDKGHFFAGTGVVRSNNKEYRLFLEVTEFNPDTRSVTLIMRNDGGWRDKRAFRGIWKTDPESGKDLVVVATNASQAIPNGGPFLADKESLSISFEIGDDGELAAATQTVDYSFKPCSTETIKNIQDELGGNITKFVAGVEAHAFYKGVVVSKLTRSSESVVLQFEQQENDGMIVQATLESMEKPGRRREMTGTIIDNAYRNDGKPLRIGFPGDDRASNAPSSSIFNYASNNAFGFRIEDNSLIGEDNGYRFELQKMSGAEVSALLAERERALKTFTQAIREGAVYDGLISDSQGFSTKTRLRIVSVDRDEGTIDLVFESREIPGVFHEMKGAFDPMERSISVASTGRGKLDTKQVLRAPIFSNENTYQMSMILGPEGLVAEMPNYPDWHASFGVDPENVNIQGPFDFDTGLPALPSAVGAYALEDKGWVLLPKNNMRVAQTALTAVTNTLDGINSVLGALSGKQPDQQESTGPLKIAELQFDGTSPIPVVKRDQVIIAFVGPIKKAPDEYIQKYPELKDYPDMEVSKTGKDSSGIRRADLYKVVPGFSGFGQNRIEGTIDNPKQDVHTYTSTSVLDPGYYCVAAGETAFEFIAQ